MWTRCAHAETACLTWSRSSRGTEGTARRSPGNRHEPPAARGSRGNGANSVPERKSPGEDEKEDVHELPLRNTAPDRPRHTLREGAFGNARALACRECGHEVELGPLYACPECFGPLEIAYDFPAVTREEIEAGPAQHLALQGAAAGARRHRAEPQHRARLHPAAQGPQPRPRARHRQPVGQGRLDQPDQLLQGPRRRLRAERRPRARRQGLRLPLDRQPRQRRRRRRRPRRDQDRGLHPEQPRAAQAGQLRRLHRQRSSP